MIDKWKIIFKASLYYFLVLILGMIADQLFDDVNDLLFPFSLLMLLFFPLLFASFVALYIMREKDREKERARKYQEEMKNENLNSDKMRMRKFR
ncbi:MAG: hypothetical protein K8R85_10690 [Bacteroidetes bacterium]|nr:hypothetical protein [Bacteroidota bacterium]